MLTDRKRQLFLQAVNEKKAGMYRVALLILKSGADAEDACEDAIEAAFGHLDSIRDENALPSYLMKCTINACKRMYKKRRKEETQADFEALLPPVWDHSPVWMYLSGLDEKYSVPIAMRFSEEMTISEISEILRIPQGTASTRIARGLKIIKKQMEG